MLGTKGEVGLFDSYWGAGWEEISGFSVPFTGMIVVTSGSLSAGDPT